MAFSVNTKEVTVFRIIWFRLLKYKTSDTIFFKIAHPFRSPFANGVPTEIKK